MHSKYSMSGDLIKTLLFLKKLSERKGNCSRNSRHPRLVSEQTSIEQLIYVNVHAITPCTLI